MGDAAIVMTTTIYFDSSKKHKVPFSLSAVQDFSSVFNFPTSKRSSSRRMTSHNTTDRLHTDAIIMSLQRKYKARHFSIMFISFVQILYYFFSAPHRQFLYKETRNQMSPLTTNCN